MPIFGKDRSESDAHAISSDLPESTDEIKSQYKTAIRSLILFLKQFALDIEEIDSDRFKSELDDLKNSYLTSDSHKELSGALKNRTSRIEKHIQRQHAYIADREREFRDIIDLLSKAMTGLNTDNRSFYRRVYDHSEKLEQITLLDDLKKMKTALETEVSQIRLAVNDQKKIEQKKIDVLANQVDSLRQELEKTKTQMQFDGLTEVYNRKTLDQYLVDLLDYSLIHRFSFALMLLDLDDFKRINDTYGHQIGDRVLVAFAQKCRSLIRQDDFIGRYGGEEFMIILPGASLRNAKKRAEKICKSLAATHYAIDSDKDGNHITVTTSIGVAVMRKKDTLAEIVTRADKALYLAKREGKNRVCTEKEI